jgi:hypothetical protein
MLRRLTLFVWLISHQPAVYFSLRTNQRQPPPTSQRKLSSVYSVCVEVRQCARRREAGAGRVINRGRRAGRAVNGHRPPIGSAREFSLSLHSVSVNPTPAGCSRWPAAACRDCNSLQLLLPLLSRRTQRGHFGFSLHSSSPPHLSRLWPRHHVTREREASANSTQASAVSRPNSTTSLCRHGTSIGSCTLFTASTLVPWDEHATRTAVS